VKLKTNRQAPPLGVASTVILLAGWCTSAPATVADDPHHVDHEFLTLYSVVNEGMLKLNGRLLHALSPGANPPDAEEIEYMRAAPGRWQEQMAKLRQRMASITIEPSGRTQ